MGWDFVGLNAGKAPLGDDDPADFDPPFGLAQTVEGFIWLWASDHLARFDSLCHQ